MNNQIDYKSDSPRVDSKEKSETGAKLYAELDENRQQTSAIAKGLKAAPDDKSALYPAAYSIIPPRLMKELAERNPQDRGLQHTRELTESLLAKPALMRPRADAGIDGGVDGAREVYDVKQKYDLPGEKARFEGEAPRNNKDVDDAYDFTGVVREFYKKEFGRNSIDDKGAKFVSSVDYGSDYSGAFWNGKQMTYGHPGEYSHYTTLVMIDICGHEITHGVTEKEGTMRYYGQSGALNESISDVFGSLIKQYAKHQTAAEADWLLGTGIWRPDISGRALRDLLHPGTAYDDKKVGKDPQPAHMRNYIEEKEDNGGVHDNSGIPNRAFAEFAIAAGGYAWEAPGHIWYNARKAAGREPSFAQFAYYTIEEAKKMNKPDLVEKLQNAWKDVGVRPSKTDNDILTPPPGPDVFGSSSDPSSVLDSRNGRKRIAS